MDADIGKLPKTLKEKLPRLYHKKSRHGCQRCRARRVKCNEQRPICGSCSRHSVACIYNNLVLTGAQDPGESNQSDSAPVTPKKDDLLADYMSSTSYPQINLDDGLAELGVTLSEDINAFDVFTIAESKVRRMLELQLLENFISSTSPTFPACHNPEARHAWSVQVPKMALQHDNLLYGIFSISALQLLKVDPENMELIGARQDYLRLFLREHRSAVARLNYKTADSVCFASTLVVIDAFAALQERSLEPYSPPMEWIQMARGAGSVFNIALNTINNYETAKIIVLVTAKPFLDDGNVLFAENNRKNLSGLLSYGTAAGEEIWDDETREVYEKTLSYIGGVQLAIKDGEHALAICRRMMAFALLVPKKFVSFVEEQRPRALVVLAHFFALAAELGHVWWIGNTVQREIAGIQKVLPLDWREQMRWPLAMARLAP